jgi:PilZ domain
MNSLQRKLDLAGAERRLSLRKRYRGELDIEWGSTTLKGTVLDIAIGGLFVELTPQLWVGAKFSARLLVSPILHLICTVRRVEPGRGNALSFDSLDEGGRLQLETILADLPLL